MGKITIEFRGFKSEASLDDLIAEKIYNELPKYALERGQITLSEVKLPKPEEKIPIQKPLLPKEVKYPTKEAIRDFIKSISPNYEFSLPLVCNHFIGFTPSSNRSNPERRIYDKMWSRIKKAKKLVTNEEKGDWTATTGEGVTVHRFEKTN